MSLDRFSSTAELIDGIGGILGYARAYRPMAHSSPPVVGGADSTAGGQAGSARSGSVIELSAMTLKPRCRCSFDE
jgi:hypothetical protein